MPEINNWEKEILTFHVYVLKIWQSKFIDTAIDGKHKEPGSNLENFTGPNK